MTPRRLDPRNKSGRDVQTMFSDIAPRYDLLNRLLSAGMDRGWRRVGVEEALRPGERQPSDATLDVLDVCCGTGDLARDFAKSPHVRRVVGVDFAEPMVQRAQHKFGDAGRRWTVGDAAHLPFADGSFDVVSVAFGLRNLVDPAAGIRELSRVLRPGGRLLVLEFFPPPRGVLQRSFRLYFHHVLPRVGRWLCPSGSIDAYRYLPESVDAFASPGDVGEWMREAGLSSIHERSMTFRTVTALTGRRPSTGTATRPPTRATASVR